MAAFSTGFPSYPAITETEPVAKSGITFRFFVSFLYGYLIFFRNSILPNCTFTVFACIDSCQRRSYSYLSFFQVDHVINFDFPSNVTDYIHRVGRTGRVKSGTKQREVAVATSFMTHNRDVRMALIIEVGLLCCSRPSARVLKWGRGWEVTHPIHPAQSLLKSQLPAEILHQISFPVPKCKRPLPSCCEPQCESEAKCKAFHMKISFVCIWMTIFS